MPCPCALPYFSGIISPQLEKAKDLCEKQQTPGLPEHKILGDVVTRWGSTYLMTS